MTRKKQAGQSPPIQDRTSGADKGINRAVNTATNETGGATEKTIGDKKYIVKSVFVGEQDVKTTLLKLAERKAIREMGLDSAVP